MPSRRDLLSFLSDTGASPDELLSRICEYLEEIDFSATDPSFDDFVEKFLRKFTDKFEIAMPERGPSEEVSIGDYIAMVIDDGLIGRALRTYEDSRPPADGFAILTDGEKAEVATKLIDLRRIITESALPERKIASLLSQIAKLETEIQLSRTPTERFFSFLGDLGMATGEMAENAKPAIAEFKDILRIVMGSRARTEGSSLPSPDTWGQLPSPEKKGPE